MDQSFAEKVLAHPAVHATVLELAKLEGQYAKGSKLLELGVITEAERDALSQRVQTVIHDLVLQACRVGLDRGYRDGVETSISVIRTRKIIDCDVDAEDLVEAIAELTADAALVNRYVQHEAFKR